MRLLILSALVATAALAERDYDAMFRQFKSTHLKAYKDSTEETQRFHNFVANMKKAEILQAANPLATFGPNVFADMSQEEFKSRLNAKAQRGNKVSRDELKSTLSERVAAAGQSVDWRKKNGTSFVSPVKDQGSCGSCWAFSVVGNIEAQWAIAGNSMTTVSEQELVACDYVLDENEGCDGGWMDTAMNWILTERNGEIVTEASYPYASKSGYSPKCVSNLDSLPVGAKINAVKDIEHNEDAMAAYVYSSGSISIALDASTFQMYSSGIVTNCISKEVNHAVLIVGFDDSSVPPYWIIKNSWGTRWGEQGYIRVSKGTNQCLLNEYPVSVVVYPTTS